MMHLNPMSTKERRLLMLLRSIGYAVAPGLLENGQPAARLLQPVPVTVRLHRTDSRAPFDRRANGKTSGAL